MPMLSSAQTTWENNDFVITTTRAFILAGVVCLDRSFYYLISRYSGVFTDTDPITRASPFSSLTCDFR